MLQFGKVQMPFMLIEESNQEDSSAFHFGFEYGVQIQLVDAINQSYMM